MPPQSREVFHGLDALRGLAAVSVLLYHAREMLGAPWLMTSGFLAVDLFFLISGFVIGSAYDGRLSTMGAAGFIKTRLTRLYPVYLLGLALGLMRVLGISLTGDVPVGVGAAAAAYLFFMPSPATEFSAESISPLNGPAWSLILEFWINVLYALLFRRLTTRVLAIVVSLSAAVLIWSTLFGSGIHGGANWEQIGIGVARVSFSFPAGILLFRHRHNLPVLPWHPSLASVLLVALFLMPETHAYSAMFVLILSPAIVCWAVTEKAENWLAVYGTKTSYVLYAIHMPLLVTLSGICKQANIGPTVPTLGLIAVLLIACWWINKWYDEPARAWLKKRDFSS